MKNLLAVIFCVGLLTISGISQDVVVERNSTEVAKRAVETSYVFSASKIVKNQPFSAEAISESTQVLPDGNRIVKSSKVKMFRDSEGRYRREPVGKQNNDSFISDASVLPSVFSFGDGITINDPVNSVRYTLYPSNKTAREYKYKSRSNTKEKGLFTYDGSLPYNGSSKEVEIAEYLKKSKVAEPKIISNGKYKVVLGGEIFSMNKNVKTESLGTKVLEGVQVEGTKTVRIIEADAIGNELPIEITYEKWYSKELDLIVYSRKYDPRYGEQIYRLSNLDRSEPDISLFRVPTDYKVVEGKDLVRFFAKPKK